MKYLVLASVRGFAQVFEVSSSLKCFCLNYCHVVMFEYNIVNSDLRLISMKDMMTTNEAYELQDFSFICKRHIEAAGNVLMHQWIPTVQAFFLQVLLTFLF